MGTVQNNQSLELLTLKRALSPSISDRQIQAFVWIARAGFVTALAGVIVLSFGPSDPLTITSELIPWDKARHYLAYLMLSALALVAFANVPAMFIGLCLFTVGLSVEMLQPAFNRTLSFMDLAANASGILTVFVVVLLAAMRARLRHQA